MDFRAGTDTQDSRNFKQALMMLSKNGEQQCPLPQVKIYSKCDSLPQVKIYSNGALGFGEKKVVRPAVHLPGM